MLGLPLFPIYINDISDGFASLPFISASDTTLFEIVKELSMWAAGLNSDWNIISKWADNGWKVWILLNLTMLCFLSGVINNSEARSNNWSCWPKRQEFNPMGILVRTTGAVVSPYSWKISCPKLQSFLSNSITQSLPDWDPLHRKFRRKGIRCNSGRIMSDFLKRLKNLGKKNKQPLHPKGGDFTVW